MPLLVKRIDSEVEAIDLVIAQLADSRDDGRRVREQVRAGRMRINQQAPVPDLHVDPVHRDLQYAGELVRAEHVLRMPPSRSLLGVPFQTRAIPYALDRVRQNLVGAVRRVVSLAVASPRHG
jgi:hypothetical protein